MVTTGQAPTVDSVSPDVGSDEGDRTVKVSGSGFTQATQVLIGGVGATSLTVLSDSTLSAVTPVGSGTEDVQVVGPGGASATSANDQYNYEPDARFVAQAPKRVLDTRLGMRGILGAVGPGKTLTLSLAGEIDATATAVVLNVTAVAPSASTYLSVFPGGSARPGTSNINDAAGHTVANQVTVSLGPNQTVSFFNDAGTVNVLADLEGIYSPVAGDTYASLPPRRVLDTRNATGAPKAEVGPGAEVRLSLSGVIPQNADAVVLNVTAVRPSTATYISLNPTSLPPPTSNLNVAAGAVVAGLVTTAVTSGSVVLYNDSGQVNLVADVVGYYAPAQVTAFTSGSPTRVVDTRNGTGVARGRIGAAHWVTVSLAGELPSDATTAVLNLTALDATAATFVTAYAGGSSLPPVSSLNATLGQIVDNQVLVPLGPNQTVSIYNSQGAIDVVADLEGYLSPDPLVVVPTPLTATVGVPAMDTLEVVGAGAATNYTMSVQGLPSGIGQDPTEVGDTGDLAGLPSAAGSVSLAVSVSDVYGANATATIPLVVDSSSPLVASLIASGYDGGCAVVAGGQVSCWGLTAAGPDDQNAPLPTATVVPGLANVIDVSTADGDDGSCAVVSGGVVECWNGGTAPAPIGISDANAVSGGYGGPGSDGCALLVGGEVSCWGVNNDGEIGNGTTGSTGAGTVVGITSATDVSVGNDSSCSALSNGEVECWGAGTQGQLGDGSTASSDVPVQVHGITDATSVSVGSDTACATLGTGSVDCWGNGAEGVLGDGDPSDSQQDVPVGVVGITNATAVSTADSSSCALVAGGRIVCWGADQDGQLGDGGATSQTAPVMADISGAVAVQQGGSNACALLVGGTVSCWGSDARGQDGNGIAALNGQFAPLTVASLSNVTAIDTDDLDSCAVESNGSVWCWGDNTYGELGNGTTNSAVLPTAVSGVAGATAIATGEESTCAIVADGAVSCWGANEYGQLGNGTSGPGATSLVPVAVDGVSDAVSIGSTGYSFCALLGSGSVDCWGENEIGQLGDGTTTNRAVPVAVTGISDASALSVGGGYACVVVSGALECWGYNVDGELDVSGPEFSTTPVAPANLADGVVSVGAGDRAGCAVMTTGAVYCWGDVPLATLAPGTDKLLTGIGSVVSVSGGDDSFCAVETSGTPICWGSDTDGQLGTGGVRGGGVGQFDEKPPANVGSLVNVSTIVAGYDNSCAISAGVASCWGSDTNDELGSDQYPVQLTPGSVIAG